MAKHLVNANGGSGKGPGPRPGGSVLPTNVSGFPKGPNHGRTKGVSFPVTSNGVSNGRPAPTKDLQMKAAGKGRTGK